MTPPPPSVPPSDSAGLTQRAAFFLLIALVLLWGVNWPVMKIGLAYIPPLWFATIRMIMGAACLLAVLAALRKPLFPPRGDWPVIVSVGFFQMTVNMGLINLGLQYVPAGRSSVLVYTTPLWVTPAAVWLLGEKMTWLKGCGLALGLAGLIVLFDPTRFDWSDRDVLLGNGFLLLSALGWSIGIIHVRWHRWHATPLVAAPWQMLVACLPLGVSAFFLYGTPPVSGPADFWLALAYNGPIATAFCVWAAVAIARSLPAITTSLSFLGVPMVGIASAALLIGEVPEPSLLAGFALIVLGVGAVTLSGRGKGA